MDMDRGRVAYVALSFGGFLGLGDKLFAFPWQTCSVDSARKALTYECQALALRNELVPWRKFCHRALLHQELCQSVWLRRSAELGGPGLLLLIHCPTPPIYAALPKSHGPRISLCAPLSGTAPQAPLSLQHVDPLIRELVHYRDLIQQRMQQRAQQRSLFEVVPETPPRPSPEVPE